MVIEQALPYKVTTRKLGQEAEEWCFNKIGPRWFAVGRKDGLWTAFWAGRDMPKNYHWYFKNEKDAFIFALRWS